MNDTSRIIEKMDNFGKNADGEYADISAKAIWKALGNDALIEKLEKANQKAEEEAKMTEKK